MKTSQKIRMALAYRNMSEAELARKIGSTPSVSYTHLDVYKRQIYLRYNMFTT